MLEAKQRAEAAHALVAEKNHRLESLSNQLSKYLSPQIYASIFSGDQSVEITSKRKKLTVFFADIADFTATTDSMESEDLTSLLNRYLTEMSKIALEHGATIDKYVGDSIIAFFGDPETRGVKEDAGSSKDGPRNATTHARASLGMAGHGIGTPISDAHWDQYGLLHGRQFRQ